ncbi:hypothetical protein OIV19_20710 [Brucella sp. HL-2]|nr:hypothetical protein [Brucella sp. HL-2]MCV9910025.1 hypothetical protein [Brucella sp. HL-2]
MRNLSMENYSALQARELVARDFIWFTARNRATGAPFSYGFWSDVGNVNAPILNPNTGLAETRNFEGSGTLIQISDIPLVANLTVQTITVNMNQISEGVQNIVRGYDLKQGGVEVYRGLFSPVSRQIVSPAINRFIGYVDQIEIKTTVYRHRSALTPTRELVKVSLTRLSRQNTTTSCLPAFHRSNSRYRAASSMTSRRIRRLAVLELSVGVPLQPGVAMAMTFSQYRLTTCCVGSLSRTHGYMACRRSRLRDYPPLTGFIRSTSVACRCKAQTV